MLIGGILTLKDWRGKMYLHSSLTKIFITSNKLMQNRNCMLIYFKTEAWTHKDFEATKNHIVAEGFISQNMTKTSRSKKHI